MRISRITPNNNTNFKALIISKYYDEWDKKALKKFVNNEEVQKLTDIYSWSNKDIEAYYIAPKDSKDSAKIRLCEFNEENFPGKFITDIRVSQLRRFFGFSVKKFFKDNEKRQ